MSAPNLDGANALPAELDEKLRVLFTLYDTNGSSHIEVDQFLAVEELLRGEENFDEGAARNEYSDLTGHVETMSFADFCRWQVGLRSQTCATHKEMADAVQQTVFTILRSRRSGNRRRPAAGAGSNAARDLRHVDDDLMRDQRISELASALRPLRIRRRLDRSAGITDEEAETVRRLKELVRQRKEALVGKIIIRGSTMCGMEPVQNARVSLLHKGNQIAATTSNAIGSFEMRLDAVRGRRCVLEVSMPGFAKASTRVAGEGAKTIRVEMMRLAVVESFQATPGSAETTTYVDPSSGTQFRVPTGQITKNGVPFEGDVEFSAAVVDVGSPGGLQAMPPLAGQSVGGAIRPMQTMGCVFVNLKDGRDGSPLALDQGGSGISVSMTAAVGASKTQPSVWRYDEALGQWVQTSAPLVVNGSELDPPNPNLEERAPFPLVTEALEDREEAQEENLQQGRQQLDAQRRAGGEEKICSCGFEAKKAIMPLVVANRALCCADPPKRIFAATERVARSSVVRPVYEYQTEAQRQHGAVRAAADRAVIFSHHLGSACAILGNPVTARGGPWAEEGREGTLSFSSAWWKTDTTREALPHLAVISEFLVAGALAHEVQGDDGPLSEAVPASEAGVDETVVKLKALELLVGYWAQARERQQKFEWTAGPTLHEMVNAFYDCGEDVGEALLLVAAQQARRSEIRRVRRQVAGENTDIVIPHDVVSKALDDVDGDVGRACVIVREHPRVVKYREKFEARRELFKALPMARPKSSELEKALADAGGNVKEAARLLADDPKVQEDAQKVKQTWEETVAEANERMDLEFGVMEPGYVNVDAPVEAEEPPEPVDTKDREFFRRPLPLCAERDYSMVMGLFDDGVGAARAMCVAQSSVTVETAEDVQPDGTFSLSCVCKSEFRLKTTKADGTEGYSWGPFWSAGGGDVRNLGLLSVPRDNDVSWGDMASSMQITLPPLEFPRARPKADGEAEDYAEQDPDEPPEEFAEDDHATYFDYTGTWRWDCTGRCDLWPDTLREFQSRTPAESLVDRRPPVADQIPPETTFKVERYKNGYMLTIGDFRSYGEVRGKGYDCGPFFFLGGERKEKDDPDGIYMELRVDDGIPEITVEMGFLWHKSQKPYILAAVKDDGGERCTCFDLGPDPELELPG